MGTLVYASYLFLSWGRDTLAGVPNQPPLSLPQLVRSVPAEGEPRSAPLSVLLQPSVRRSGETQPLLTDRVTVLVMGVDQRPDETVSRTDSILVLTLNPSADSAGIMSLPRDLLVPVAGLTDTVKINTVHVRGELSHYPGGGPALLVDTVTELIGYPIDYYVRLNFEGFKDIVDLVGGIEIDVPREIRDDTYPDEAYGYDPLYISAGLQQMDGELALKYARTRHVDSDYGRAGRQQQVILAIADKVMRPGQVAALLPRLPGLALAMANTVQTDMPVEQAIMLARLLGQFEIGTPRQVVVDREMGEERDDPVKGFVLIPDMAKLRAAASELFADSPDAAATAEPSPVVDSVRAEGARLVVLNGTQEEVLASTTADQLRELGFTILTVGNAERADYAQTWLVTYGDAAPATREALIQHFQIPAERIISQPPGQDRDLTLIVGADQIPSAR